MLSDHPDVIRSAAKKMLPSLGMQQIVGTLLIIHVLFGTTTSRAQSSHPCVSGIYPHLAMFNDEQECGTGVVVPWADRLWVVTYAPHKPFGSSDKLYEIDGMLNRTVRPESVGGTPANRMIHRESQQLFLSHYAIDAQRNVRVIPIEKMPGRLTGMARHLFDPTNKVYIATMEEGFYELDVHSLGIKVLFPDGNQLVKEGKEQDLASSLLPGYHGKGFYSGQGWLIYANNGERSSEAQKNPQTVSGVLAQWSGKGPWQMIRRNQFTEVTGPGGIFGNAQPDKDPVWSIGWDHRSLILMLLQRGRWQTFRLPKGSHSYDGAHGWNTEWPRVREIGEKDLLMTMHGTFWRFPFDFGVRSSAGISPRSNYLKVIGDFCRWKDQIVFGCDDSAKSEFLNARRLKNKQAAPGQSNSGLWFVQPNQLDDLGPLIGRGAVWLRDDLQGGSISDPYLLNGYERKLVHVAHDSEEPVTFEFEVDQHGNGEWLPLCSLSVPPHGYEWHSLTSKGQWIRAKTHQSVKSATVYFQYSNPDTRSKTPDTIFASWPKSDTDIDSAGTVWSLGNDEKVLGFVAVQPTDESVRELGYYELDGNLKLFKKDRPAIAKRVQEAAPLKDVIEFDAASVIIHDDDGVRYRLPKGEVHPKDFAPMDWPRICREVVTERDLLNCSGTFYELPARNAGGLAKIRPIATHNSLIYDFASYRGMLVVSGLKHPDTQNEHVVISDDKKCALWLGVVDDLWRLGKPRGRGGPWKNTSVLKSQPSDPYLMTGYNKKYVRISHKSAHKLTVRLEVDLDGNGLWRTYRSFDVGPTQTVEHRFPANFAAYWVRAIADADTIATAEFIYE